MTPSVKSTSLKYIQGWRFHHCPVQPIPMLNHPQTGVLTQDGLSEHFSQDLHSVGLGGFHLAPQTCVCLV